MKELHQYVSRYDVNGYVIEKMTVGGKWSVWCRGKYLNKKLQWTDDIYYFDSAEKGYTAIKKFIEQYKREQEYEALYSLSEKELDRLCGVVDNTTEENDHADYELDS